MLADLVHPRFEAVSVAGVGGLGVVYRCRDRNTGGPVAVKVAPSATPKQRERFLIEAQTLSAIDHPNVVRYLAHGLLETGEPYLAMEWLEGEDLHTRLARTALTTTESLAMGRALASALAAAHTRGIIHRDVKPANVFLVGGDPARPKLIDFGIARAGAQGLSLPGNVMGTPGYMAPEQARGEPQIDARADVFSLGCVLFECLSGRRAFLGDSPMAILAKILLEEPPQLRALHPEAPAALDHIVSRMMAKSKESRYASAAEVLRDLERLDEATEERAIPGAAASSGTLTSRERRILSVLLARRGETRAEGSTLADDELLAVESAPTLAPSGAGEGLRQLAARLGIGAEVLLDGSLMVVLEGTDAIDQATRAAHLSLRLRAAGDPAMRLAVATGRGELSGSVPYGEVLDRACALLDAPPHPSGVRVDSLTSDLTDRRFRQVHDEHGAALVEEAELDGARTVLGRRTSCVGRERELSMLLGLYDEATEERSPLVAVLTGEAGLGKSRMKHELVERLRARADNVLVLSGRGDVAQPGAPFGVLSAALRRELGLRPEHSGEERRHRTIARVARTSPAEAAERLAPFLAQLAGLPLGDASDTRLEAARRDPIVMGDLLRAAWQDFLEAEGRVRPILLVVEDLQWGDRPSINMVDAAIRALRDTPLFVLASARPEVASVFPDLFAQRGATRIALSRLGSRASKDLLRELLGKQHEARIEALALAAAGNPYFLEELARAVAQGRAGVLPDTILATAQARLETLSSGARRVLRAAAVLGDDLSVAGLAAILPDLDAPARTLLLTELVAEDILERDPGPAREYAIRHGIVREASYASLTRTDRKLAHGLAAKWLAARGGADALTLATHLEHAGELQEACGHYLEAGEHSLEGSDLEGTVDCVTRATACGAEGETLGRLRWLRSEVHRWRGEHAEVREQAARAVELLPEGSAIWLAARVSEATSSALLGDLSRIEGLATLLCLLLEGGDVTGAVVSAGGRAAGMLARYRANPGVSRRIAAALSVALPKCRDERAVGMVLAALSMEATSRDALEDALAFGEAACASFLAAGDVRNACQARLNGGYTLMQLGQYARAEAALREGRDGADRAGVLPLVALAQHNLGPTLLHHGDPAAAEAAERDAIQSFSAQGDKRLVAASRYYLGRILLAAGRVEEAEAEMRGAISDAEGVAALQPIARAGLARVLLARGREREALDVATDALARLEERGGRAESPQVVRLVAAEALLASGHEERAGALIEALRTDLTQQAGRLRDPDLKKSFLSDVDDHARVFELANARLP